MVIVSGACAAAGKAAQSAIGDVNGEEGKLIYQGYNIHDLAEHSTFEEVIFLLWNGRLPNKAELDEHVTRLRRNYAVPTEVIELMKQYPKNSNRKDVLRNS
jgi:citrate synthase